MNIKQWLENRRAGKERTPKEHYVLCYNGHAVEVGFSTQRKADARRDSLNAVRTSSSVSFYCSHPESEIDGNTVCPHGKARSGEITRSLIADLADRAAQSPRLAALLEEMQRGLDRRQS